MNKLNKELFNKVKEDIVVVKDNRVSDEKLLELIIIDYDKVSSKNGMLKLLRNNGISVSMNRKELDIIFNYNMVMNEYDYDLFLFMEDMEDYVSKLE